MTREEIEARSARNKAAWKIKPGDKVLLGGINFKNDSPQDVFVSADGSQVYVDPVKPSKYKNKKTEVDGILFDSKREAERYLELKALQAAGSIHFLRRQIRVPLVVAETLVAHWVADFEYIEGPIPTGPLIWEDVKSDYTRKLPVYRLKKKLVKAIYGREIKET